jgi:MoxR-like ATPase
MSSPTGFTSSKSCDGCPSLLDRSESVSYFGKTVGSAMCAQFGTILGRPGFTTDEERSLRKRIARDCKRHGQDRPKVGAGVFAPLVAVPLVIEDDHPSLPASKVAASTCPTCIFYRRPDEVVSEFGWTSGMCQRKGMLILPNQTREVASNCDVSIQGSPIHFDVELRDFYEADYHHVDIFATYGAGVTHPLQHVTDRPVTDAQAASGIMSWRRISDPEDKDRFTFLPVYNPAMFSDTERSKIPQPGDDEHPELYLDYGNNVYKIAVLWRELDETPMAWGPGGVGKTEVARHLAYLMQLPFERISITSSTEVDDIVGKMMFGVPPEKAHDPEAKSETYFQYGRLPLAWEKPCVTLIDEPNTAQPDLWQLLRPLLDNSRQLVADQSDSRRFIRNDNCYLMMAGNPTWDPKNVGTNSIGDADASRLMHIRFGLPPENLEKKIIAERVKLDGWEISNEQLRLLMTVANDLRSLSDQGTITTSWGIRHQIKVARSLKWFSAVAAFALATDDMSPDEADVVLESVRSAFKEK